MENFRNDIQKGIQKYLLPLTYLKVPRRLRAIAQSIGLLCIFGVALKIIWNLAFKYLSLGNTTMHTAEAILYASASLGVVLLTDLMYND